MENEFPPNSHGRRETRPTRPSKEAEKPEKKQVVRVTQGRVIRKPKTLRQKFVETFFSGAENKGVMEYLVIDVLVPGARDLVVDIMHTGVDRKFYGTDGIAGPRRGGYGGRGHTEYNRMGAARPRTRDDRTERRVERTRGRGAPDVSQIILASRVEADEVVDTLFELLKKYETVTMRDLLGLLGEPHEFTDEDWGWTDLRGTRVHRIKEGFLLDLPRVEPLD